MSPPAPAPTPALAETLEGFLQGFLEEARPRIPLSRGPGRPAVLAAMLLWSGLLVCLLRGFSSQLQLWRLLAHQGLWNWPRVAICDMALYKRLERTPPTALQTFFQQITAALQARFTAVSDFPFASWATAVVALDQTTLDPVLRKLKLLRGVRPGADALLPGALACLFDLRRQQWQRVEFVAHAKQHCSQSAREMLRGLLPGTLLLADLGYFDFAWFDHLTDCGYFFVSRLKQGTSSLTKHVFFADTRHGIGLRESVIYLGAFGAKRARHPLRLIEVTVGERTYRYLTNVLDPRRLPAREVVELYRRRWDIEQAFNLLKTHLGLHLLWSGHRHVLLQQVFATLIIAQIVLALRTEVALQANAELREVSLALLIQWLPQLAATGRDPVAEFVRDARRVGFIRPFRGQEYRVPAVAWEEYAFPERYPPPRGPGETGNNPKKKPPR